MARKTTQQQLDERLKELRGELGNQQDKLEDIERRYSKEVSVLEGQALEDFEAEITAQRYIVRQVQEKIDAIKADKSELDADQEAANNYKWKEVEPLLLDAIKKYHISYNVINNKYTYCMDFGDNNLNVINPVFQSFDGARATSAFSKLIDKYLFNANDNIHKLFITKNYTHYSDTASFLYAKWAKDKVYNKAKVISSFWLEPDFGDEPYDPDFDLLFYCIGGGKQENIDYLKQWITYKLLFPERVANTPNMDLGGSPGGNGKTLYMELAKTIFTQNCVVLAAAKELDDGFNGTWETAVIVHFDEPTEKELPAGKMKKATGGLETRVERKGVDAYPADRNYSIVATSNNLLGVFKLSGSGSGGEDRRYSVINTNIPLLDEIMLREGCDAETAKTRANEIASKVKDRKLLARFLGAIITQFNVHQMNVLPPLHGEDYKQRFEDQKSNLDTVFDQLLPIFNSCGVINVKIIQDIITLLQDGKKADTRVVKKKWKEYLNRNRIEYTEHARDRIDIVMSGHSLAQPQGHVFRLKAQSMARIFPWDRISTAIPVDTKKDDLLIL
jgi:hypothetical protein